MVLTRGLKRHTVFVGTPRVVPVCGLVDPHEGTGTDCSAGPDRGQASWSCSCTLLIVLITVMPPLAALFPPAPPTGCENHTLDCFDVTLGPVFSLQFHKQVPKYVFVRAAEELLFCSF